MAHSLHPSSGQCFVSIPDDLVDKVIASIGYSLVGKFVGLRPNIDSVHSWVAKKWKNKDHINVLVMAKGFFPFTFTYEEDLVAVFMGGPWIFGNATLTLKWWEPIISPLHRVCDATLVWVRLPCLPLEFTDEEVFRGIVVFFEELLSIDPMMNFWKRLVYALICVNSI